MTAVCRAWQEHRHVLPGGAGLEAPGLDAGGRRQGAPAQAVQPVRRHGAPPRAPRCRLYYRAGMFGNASPPLFHACSPSGAPPFVWRGHAKSPATRAGPWRNQSAPLCVWACRYGGQWSAVPLTVGGDSPAGPVGSPPPSPDAILPGLLLRARVKCQVSSVEPSCWVLAPLWGCVVRRRAVNTACSAHVPRG